MNPDNYNELIEMHSAAKRKMTIGIVLTAIGYFGALILSYAFLYLYVFLIYLNDSSVMVMFCYFYLLLIPGAIVMMALGIPRLIRGIIGRVKANNRLRALKR